MIPGWKLFARQNLSSLFPIQQLIFYRFEEGPEKLQNVLDHGSKQASHSSKR